MVEERKNAQTKRPADFRRGWRSSSPKPGKQAKARPVERWNPPYCGEIDIRIAADGAWFYRGSAIGREALVRLFASILRREPDGRHVLVTPVEKVGITVEDAPFMAVEVVAEGDGAERPTHLPHQCRRHRRRRPRSIRCASPRRRGRTG